MNWRNKFLSFSDGASAEESFRELVGKAIRMSVLGEGLRGSGKFSASKSAFFVAFDIYMELASSALSQKVKCDYYYFAARSALRGGALRLARHAAYEGLGYAGWGAYSRGDFRYILSLQDLCFSDIHDLLVEWADNTEVLREDPDRILYKRREDDSDGLVGIVELRFDKRSAHSFLRGDVKYDQRSMRCSDLLDIFQTNNLATQLKQQMINE